MGRKKVIDGGSVPATAWKPGTITKGNLQYDDEMRERIVNMLWDGEYKSIAALSRAEGMPSRRIIHNWKRQYPEFGDELERAQIALGDLYVDDIHKTMDDVRKGKLDPSQGSVLIKSDQWLAQITDPRTYANKSYVEKNETVNVKTTHVNRIEIDGLSDEQLDALENALQAKLLTGPDGVSNTAGED